ncbi:MAG: murein hydrolase activator EnvC family protein [Candidatus Bruticola sp.]
MGRRIKLLQIGLFSAILALLLTSAFPVQADPNTQLRQKKSQLETQRRRLDIINDRERDLSRQLSDAQAELQYSREAYREAKLSLKTAEENLQSISKRLNSASKEYKKSQLILGKRLREIYLQGDVGYLVVLLGAESFIDFIDQTYYLSLIIENDRRLVSQVRSLKRELEVKKVQSERTVRQIKDLKEAQENRVKQLESIESKRSALLADTRRQRDSLSSYVSELENSTQALENQIQSAVRRSQVLMRPTAPNAGTRTWGTGRYLNPAQGPITSPFGYRVHPIFGTMRFHTGIDIGAYYGSPILASDSGVVIDSGWMGGYGNCIIVDHGGGYSTLYAHCSELYVSYGQSVTKGQQIAAVGSTGNSTGPHLHFEVRINGEPVDPLGFI